MRGPSPSRHPMAQLSGTLKQLPDSGNLIRLLSDLKGSIVLNPFLAEEECRKAGGQPRAGRRNRNSSPKERNAECFRVLAQGALGEEVPGEST